MRRILTWQAWWLEIVSSISILTIAYLALSGITLGVQENDPVIVKGVVIAESLLLGEPGTAGAAELAPIEHGQFQLAFGQPDKETNLTLGLGDGGMPFVSLLNSKTRTIASLRTLPEGPLLFMEVDDGASGRLHVGMREDRSPEISMQGSRGILGFSASEGDRSATLLLAGAAKDTKHENISLLYNMNPSIALAGPDGRPRASMNLLPRDLVLFAFYHPVMRDAHVIAVDGNANAVFRVLDRGGRRLDANP